MKRKLWLFVCVLCAVVLSNIPYAIAELCLHPNIYVSQELKYYAQTEGGHDYRTDTYWYCPDCDDTTIKRTAVYSGHEISFVTHWHVDGTVRHAYKYTCYPCGYLITRYETCSGNPCVITLYGVGNEAVLE